MKKLLLGIFLLMTCAMLFASGGNIHLIKDGKARAVIVIENDNVSTKKAGEELQAMLQQRTGAKLQIITAKDPIPNGMIPIYLGLSDRTRKLGVNDKTLKYDGYFFKATPEYVVIAGRDNPQTDEAISGHTFIVCNYKLNYYVFGEKGTVNGVYKILEKYAGNRHYMPGKLGEVVPTSPDFSLPVSQHTDAPAFRERYFYGVWFRDGNPDFLRWYYQMCCGGQNNSINHSYNAMFHKYKKTNPEYFALIGGKRDLRNLSTANLFGNLCMTNKEGIQAFAKLAQNFFDKHPNYTTYAVVPQDGLFKICECPECQKLASPHLGQNGRFSNAVFHHAAEIAKIVGKTHPDKMIGTLAYAGYRVPPEMDLPPNLAVRICYRRQDLRDPVRKKEIEDSIKGYAQKKVPILVWTYALFNYRPPMRGIPVFYPNILQQNIKFNRDHGVIGEFSESSFHAGAGDQDVKERAQFAFPGFTHLNNYVRSQLLWNPDLDLKAMLDEYYTLFYGPAADEMRLFWETAERLFLKNGEATAYTTEDLELFLKILKDAEKKASADTVYGQRVRLIHNEIKPFFATMLRLRDKSKFLGVTVVKEDIPLEFSLDSVWKYARVTMLTYKNGLSNVPKKNQTFLYTIANEKGFGLHVLCKEPDVSKLRAQFMTRDDGENAWRDDCLELFLVTSDRRENRHYIITSGGNIVDGLRSVDIHVSDWDWTTKMKLKITKGKGEYSYTMIIPWEDLNMTFQELPELRFQLFRRQTFGDKQSGTYYTVFPAMGYHNYSPEYFGPIRFMGVENRLPNGSLRELDAKGEIANWEGQTSPASKKGMKGGQCIKVCGLRAKSNQTIYSSMIPVTENCDFALSFRYTGAASYAFLLFYDKNKKVVPYNQNRPVWLAPQKDWTFKSIQGRVPAGAASIKIAFRNFDGGPEGGAWFDSVEFSGGIKFLKPNSGFKNGSFEVLNKNGSIAGWSTPFNLHTEGAADGKHAIRVAAKNNDWLKCDRFPVRGGTDYRLKLQHRGSAGFVYFFFYDGKGKQIGNAKYHWIKENKEWKENVFSGTFPNEAAFCAIGLRNFTPNIDKGAWFDNLIFETE